VPAPIIELIKNMYQNNNKIIRANRKMEVEIKILRGVKQGGRPLVALAF
jgi:hypothetical protein